MNSGFILIFLIVWAALTVFFASLCPGAATIEPTDGCKREEAKRLLYVEGICSPSTDAMMPDVGGTEICVKELRHLRNKCHDAIEYNMDFMERLEYYGLLRWIWDDAVSC